jgi:hypothetical protein
VLVGLVLGFAVSAILPAAGLAATRLPTQTITTRSTAVIRPRAPLPTGAVVSSQVVTVTRGKRTVATDRPSARVGPGVYTARSTVLYRPLLTGTVASTLTAVLCEISDVGADISGLHYDYAINSFDDRIWGDVPYTYTSRCSGRDATDRYWEWTAKATVTETIEIFPNRGVAPTTVLEAASHHGRDPVAYFAPPPSLTELWATVSYLGPVTTTRTIRTVRVVRR